jgi:hypothetical protein
MGKPYFLLLTLKITFGIYIYIFFFKLIQLNDWTIDYLTPGGVDTDGWQYAVDFSTSYHARKSITDYVRRRRWARKCKLLTSGPWEEIGNSKITDVSLQVMVHVCTKFLFMATLIGRIEDIGKQVLVG